MLIDGLGDCMHIRQRPSRHRDQQDSRDYPQMKFIRNFHLAGLYVTPVRLDAIVGCRVSAAAFIKLRSVMHCRIRRSSYTRRSTASYTAYC
jgi:hypothetical protein